MNVKTLPPARSAGLPALAAVLLLLAAITICGCSQSTGIKAAAGGDSVYERVMRSGKLRCAYVVYSPGCLKDPNTGKLSGIGIDALELAAKNLGLTLEWAEEVGWGSMIEGLETNRYDIIATPIWTNSTRARLVDFGKPIYYSPIFAYVKAGDRRFSGGKLGQLDSPRYSIACMDGETAQVIAREDFPQAKNTALPQLTDAAQLLLTVSTGKADVTFAEPILVGEFLKHNPQAVERVEGARPLRVFPNCWMFRRNQMAFKSMLDTALDQLVNSGEIDKLISRYESTPATIYRVALPYRVPAAGER